MAEALDTYSDLDMSDSEDEAELNALDREFKSAADYLKSLAPDLESDKLLQLYSYYKQATEGPCNVLRPKWYDLRAKQKWDAWNSLGDVSPDAAKEKYVAIITEIKPDWNADAKEGTKNNTQHWVAVSSLLGDCADNKNEDMTIYDHCKEGDVWKVQSMLENEPSHLNQLDADGLGLIHWAADRGQVETLRMLLKINCDISLRDESGQTALHYASSCGHIECVMLLLQFGIDKFIKDNDGMTAADLASDDDLKRMLL